MRLYLILFAVVVIVSVIAAIYAVRKLGNIATFVIGALITAVTVVLFFVSKSDSVADSYLETLADLSPPLVTGSIVVGWWLGYAVMRWMARRRS